MGMSATAIPTPSARWDLSALFSSLEDPKIEQTWNKLNADADAFAARYRGKIEAANLDAATLSTAIRELEALLTEAEKPGTYAGLRFAAEVTNPEIGAFMQEQMEKTSALRIKLLFFELELQATPDATIDTVLADQSMAKYRHYVERTRAYSPHKLSEKEEVILEETANTGIRAWRRYFEEVLSNQKFDYTDPVSGEKRELTVEETLNLLRESNRAVRKAAADSFSAGLESQEHALCFVYNTLLNDKQIEDRLRGFPTPEFSRHLANELDQKIVDIVVDLCKANSGMVARYYRVKKEMLGLPELTHVDRYAPLAEAKKEVGYDEAWEIILDSFAGFHPEMESLARQFRDENWVDAEPRQGKTSGAFCSYMTPDTHPVVLMTYLNKMSDVGTLAHELGHGVHGALSRAQSYVNFEGTLPLAELASIFAEMLVFEKLVSKADLDDKLALYCEKIEGMFASVHRQASMFRFERRAHALRREEGECRPEDFGNIWQEELQSMFEDSIQLGEQHRRWWSYVSHFFEVPFYVYAYAFGELLTLALYARAKTEGAAFAERYIELLRLGGARSPKDLMATVDVDLTSREFWEGGFKAIDALVSECEALWQKKKASS